jgi:16S rRNA (uracil1498-N3)-methyltransferase
MVRFFVAPDVLSTTEICLTGEVAHQIARVLRMRPGDRVLLLDGQGYEYHIRLLRFGRDRLWGEVVGRTRPATESACRVDLYLSVLNKPDKFEWALQKCTELGAARFVPVIAHRSVAAPPNHNRYERWQKIVREAAEQSGRTVLPSLQEAVTFTEAISLEARRLNGASSAGGPDAYRSGNNHSSNDSDDSGSDAPHVAFMPSPGAGMPLANAIGVIRTDGRGGSVSIFIGPEGGFTEDELAEAQENGLLLVSLGPRTLRAETAAVAALTMVLYELGQLG